MLNYDLKTLNDNLEFEANKRMNANKWMNEWMVLDKNINDFDVNNVKIQLVTNYCRGPTNMFPYYQTSLSLLTECQLT